MAFWKYSLRENGFFCFPLECYFALLSLCGISEMLAFSEVDFIRICLAISFDVILLVFFVLFFFKVLLLGIYRFLTLSCCNYATERYRHHLDKQPRIL